MPAQVEINLAAAERKQLEKNIRSRKTPVRLRERSQIVLTAANRVPNYIIAERLELDINTVGRWRNRFAEKGYPGIVKDRPRGANHGSRNSVEQAKLRSLIIKKPTKEKPDGATHWSVRSLARELGTTHSLVGRVWKEMGLKPHPERQFKVSNDLQFEEKLHDVAGLYLNPPEKAVVFCVDEKSSIQALEELSRGCRSRRDAAPSLLSRPVHSWLNLVERFFGLITEKQIRRGVFRSLAALEQSIQAFIEHRNANKKPFVWTKSAADILEKVGQGESDAISSAIYIGRSTSC